jgi:hypothetical protein
MGLWVGIGIALAFAMMGVATITRGKINDCKKMQGKKHREKTMKDG